MVKQPKTSLEIGLHFKQILLIFVILRQEEHKSSQFSCHFVPKDQNKLCAHDKNMEHAELWVRSNSFNVFVTYALDWAHQKFDV